MMFMFSQHVCFLTHSVLWFEWCMVVVHTNVDAGHFFLVYSLINIINVINNINIIITNTVLLLLLFFSCLHLAVHKYFHSNKISSKSFSDDDLAKSCRLLSVHRDDDCVARADVDEHGDSKTQFRDSETRSAAAAASVRAMQRTRDELTLIALIACVATSAAAAGLSSSSPCPFSLANRTSSGNCRCNRMLHEITCTDLDAVPDFTLTSADDHFATLYLRRGTIGGLAASAFAGLPRLVKIVVDFHPLDVAGVHQAAFYTDTQTSTLSELSIGASRVRSLPSRLLAGLSQLRRLSVWATQVDHVPGGFFKPVATSLLELSLWGNRLERIDESTFDVGGRKHWFALQTLDLDRNAISWLGRDSFRSMPNVETLRLAGNRVAALSADALSGLHRLRSLRLEHNGLGFVHATAFVDLEDLISLSLGDNALAFLPDGLFKPLGRLVDLRLQNNKLEYVWWRTFRGLRSLRRMDLSGNRLSNLPDDVFRHSTRLSVLALDDNHLRTLRRCSLPPVDASQPSPSPAQSPPRTRRRRTVSLMGNTGLRCDCRLAWLAAQVTGGITTVWGLCDIALDPPPTTMSTQTLLDGKCPIVAVVLRQRFGVCPTHTRHQNNCKA